MSSPRKIRAPSVVFGRSLTIFRDLTPFISPTPAPIPVVPTPQPPSRTGTKKALCVGINNYAPPNRLTGCVPDAHLWEEVLTRNGFATNLVLDEQATYDGITSALRGMVQSSRQGGHPGLSIFRTWYHCRDAFY